MSSAPEAVKATQGRVSLTILHLIPTLTGGGAERQLAYLAPALAARGHRVRVGYVHEGPNLDRLRGTAVGVHRLRCRGNHDPGLVAEIGRLIVEVRPDVVQTWLLQMDVFGGIAARWHGVPWILSERASAQAYDRGWKNVLRRFMGGRAAAIVANSETGLAYWRGRVAAPLSVIRNIVPCEEIEVSHAAPTESLPLAVGDELVLAAGRIDPQKNLFTLLRAVDVLLDRRARAHAVIFGNGPQTTSLAQAHRALRHAGRVHLRPHTAELWQWMKRAAVYVSMSRYEGAPNVVLEAMASGCPIVVSDIPTHREILPSDCALWTHPDAAEDAAAAIERVLVDRSAAAAMAQRARAALGRWTAADVAGEYVTLYRQVIEKRSRD